MDKAIRVAKTMLDLPGTEAVRVVRDHYDPATGAVRPNTVFRAVAPTTDPMSARPGLLSRLWPRRPALQAPPKAERRQKFVFRVAASLIGVVLGTAFTLLRS